jgi:hypothetical protein
MLLFGFSLPEKTAKDFFSQVQFYSEYDVLGTGETYKQLINCTYDEIFPYADILLYPTSKRDSCI